VAGAFACLQDVGVSGGVDCEGLKEHVDEEDTMLASVQFPIMYSAVLAGECLEEINKVNESVVTLDLVVS